MTGRLLKRIEETSRGRVFPRSRVRVYTRQPIFLYIYIYNIYMYLYRFEGIVYVLVGIGERERERESIEKEGASERERYLIGSVNHPLTRRVVG